LYAHVAINQIRALVFVDVYAQRHFQTKITCQSNADNPCVCISLHSYDLELDHMTLILDLDLDILKMNL